MSNTRTHASCYMICTKLGRGSKNAFVVKNSDLKKFLKEENNKDDNKKNPMGFLHFPRGKKKDQKETKRKFDCNLFLRNKLGVWGVGT